MTTARPGASIEHVYALQRSLFAGDEPAVDRALAGLERRWLDEWSWVDHLPGWLHGPDEVFAALRDGVAWQQRRVVMWNRLVDEPRLVWWQRLSDEGADVLPVFADVRRALSARYEKDFDSVGLNYYRDGRDSVTWHGDRNRFWTTDPVIAIVSVGAPRPFGLRRRGGGGPSLRYELGEGDLLVMGGACQDRWEHAVPKVARTGPRISITYRHGAEVEPDGSVPYMGMRNSLP